jgi:spermidine synthase
MATAESLVESTMKRQRDDQENNGVSVDKDPNANGVSSVIPGWFSEISPMWPG